METSNVESRRRLVVIVPAYNERESVGDVVRSLNLECGEWDVLVIDDASTDETASAAATGKTSVISLPCNLGIGGAVQTGLKYAERHGYDVAVKFDGDGQHQAGEIKKLLLALDEPGVNVAIGSRFLGKHDGYKSTPIRRVGIHVFRIVNSFLIGQTVTDNTSGFRAYDRQAIEFLATHYPSFDYPEPEEVVLLGKSGFRLKEVATEMKERQGGVSSIHAFRSVYYMVKVLLAIFMVAIRPRINQKPSVEE